jgi:quercetin dioxygenase-like cupin family protein
MFPDLVLKTSHEIAPGHPEPGLTRLIGAYNDKLFLAEHHMQEGWAGTPHSHPHDQMAYVISGHLRVRAGEQTFEVRAGDSFVIKGGVEHQAWAIAPSVVIDVFTPYREDYV